MQWFRETTQWCNDTHNGVYLLNDSKSKIYAHSPHSVGQIKYFTTPLPMHTRGRKFEPHSEQWPITVPDEPTPGQVWSVPGSGNNTYQVSLDSNRWACTCAGFRFRSQCRHVEQIRSQHTKS